MVRAHWRIEDARKRANWPDAILSTADALKYQRAP
jgi:hypothetical protein